MVKARLRLGLGTVRARRLRDGGFRVGSGVWGGVECRTAQPSSHAALSASGARASAGRITIDQQRIKTCAAPTDRCLRENNAQRKPLCQPLGSTVLAPRVAFNCTTNTWPRGKTRPLAVYRPIGRYRCSKHRKSPAPLNMTRHLLYVCLFPAANGSLLVQNKSGF